MRLVEKMMLIVGLALLTCSGAVNAWATCGGSENNVGCVTGFICVYHTVDCQGDVCETDECGGTPCGGGHATYCTSGCGDFPQCYGCPGYSCN